MSKAVVRISDPDMKAIAPGYLERRRADAGMLAEASARGDLARVHEIAHNIKGTAPAYGFTEMGAIARELDQAARAGDAKTAAALVERYRDHVWGIEVVYE